MFDLILKAIRSMLRKIEIAAKTPLWENVQDKPFEDKRYTGVLFNKTLYFNEISAVTTLDALPILGETYTVRWKGTEYQCIANAMNYGGSLAMYLGNIEAFGGEKTEEPFVFVFNLAGQSDNPRHTTVYNYNYSDAAEEVAVNIKGMTGEVKKIDELFLPEAAKTALYIKADIAVVNPTYDASQYGLIKEAVRNGRTVYLIDKYDDIVATFLNQYLGNNDAFEFVGMGWSGSIVSYKLWDDGSIDITEYMLTETV